MACCNLGWRCDWDSSGASRIALMPIIIRIHKHYRLGWCFYASMCNWWQLYPVRDEHGNQMHTIADVITAARNRYRAMHWL